MTPLQRARALDLPPREATLRRSPAVQHFWENNRELLPKAWAAWEREQAQLPVLDETLFDSGLLKAVKAAWADPSQESQVRALWQPVASGVYQAQFFDPERLSVLRAYMAAAAAAQIPARPPYGIVLNRDGVMLDQRSSGYLAGPSFQALYARMVDSFMRPISRLLFPEVPGFDTQSFGFSIRYQPGMDTSIRPHTDASTTTLNINLNLPGESFSGSEVDFFEPQRPPARFAFSPGVAVIHRGSVAHAAHHITEGERNNFVLWLYGDRGQTPYRGGAVEQSARERWSTPAVEADGYAPF